MITENKIKLYECNMYKFKLQIFIRNWKMINYRLKNILLTARVHLINLPFD